MFLPVCAIPLTDDRRRKCAKALRDALRHADLTLDTAAREAERNVRQFARQLDGAEGSLPSLMKQPDAFWQWLGIEIAVTFGIPRDARAAVQLWRASVVKKRQARMDARVSVRRSA